MYFFVFTYKVAYESEIFRCSQALIYFSNYNGILNDDKGNLVIGG